MKYSKKTQKKIDIIEKMLEENGLLNEADRMNLELLGTQFEIYDRCLANIEENGVTMHSPQQGLKANPACNLLNKSLNTILVIMKDFGISSKSRNLLLKNLDMDGDKEESPLNVYMKSIK